MDEKKLLETLITRIIHETIDEVVPAIEKDMIRMLKKDFFLPSLYVSESQRGIRGLNIVLKTTLEHLPIICEKYPSLIGHEQFEFWITIISYTILSKLINIPGLSDIKRKAKCQILLNDLKEYQFSNPIIGNSPPVLKVIEYIENKINELNQKQIGAKGKHKYELKWNNELMDLDKLSAKLHYLEYTSMADDFKRTIQKRAKLKWKKNPEFLVYLLNQLFHYTPPIIKVIPKNNYWAASFEYFGESWPTLANSRSFSDLLNRMIKKPSKSHASTVKKVYQLIAELINKNP